MHYLTQDHPSFSCLELVERACQAGVKWVQLRIKNKPEEEVLAEAIAVKKITDKYEVQLVINDFVKVAQAVKADGVHLGKTDMCPNLARAILGPEMIIGGTANTWEDVKVLARKGVDYIGLGPFQFTLTKENLSPVLGLDGYQKMIKKMEEEKIFLPIIAIGGIQVSDVDGILNQGVYGVALAGTINFADDPKEIVNQIFARIVASKFRNNER